MSTMHLSSAIAEHMNPLTLQENLSEGEPTWCAIPVVESFKNDKGITRTEAELLVTEAIRAHEFRTTVHAMFMVIVVYTAGFVSAFFFFLTH